MSKRKHKGRDRDRNRNIMNNPVRGPMNNPFGITPQQLLGMLGGNMDMNKLGNILTSMNRDGFDLNALNQQMMNSFNIGNMNSMSNMNGMDVNNTDMNNTNNDLNSVGNTSDIANNINIDEDLEFLLSLRRIVDSSRLDLIDKIIELYQKGEIKKI